MTMYAVRNKQGRVVGRFATRAAAETCARTARSPNRQKKPFHVKVLEQIAKPPTNEVLIASDLRVTLPSVQRVVQTLIKHGDVKRIEVEGYPPHLALTKSGLQILRERVPGWYMHRQDSPIRGPARTRLLKLHADVSRKLWSGSPMRGLKNLPPPGTRVRLTGAFLKSTGQQRGGEGASVWTVVGSSGDSFVLVNEPYSEEYRQQMWGDLPESERPKWRAINKANLQIVGAKPKAGDYP
jgi:hypothetical protein